MLPPQLPRARRQLHTQVMFIRAVVDWNEGREKGWLNVCPRAIANDLASLSGVGLPRTIGCQELRCDDGSLRLWAK